MILTLCLLYKTLALYVLKHACTISIEQGDKYVRLTLPSHIATKCLTARTVYCCRNLSLVLGTEQQLEAEELYKQARIYNSPNYEQHINEAAAKLCLKNLSLI